MADPERIDGIPRSGGGSSIAPILWGTAALVVSPLPGFLLYLAVEAAGLPPVGQEDYVTLFLTVCATGAVFPIVVWGIALGWYR